MHCKKSEDITEHSTFHVAIYQVYPWGRFNDLEPSLIIQGGEAETLRGRGGCWVTVGGLWLLTSQQKNKRR